MRRTSTCLFLLVFFVVGGAGQVVQAQTFEDRQSRYQRAAYYRYAEPDDVTIQVSVWGAVRNPGVYEIPRDAHLNLLFSAAGGPSLQVRQESDEQTIRVKLVRKTEDGGREVVYRETMSGKIVVNEADPALQEGDVLTVESFIDPGLNWRDFLSIGTSLTSLVLTAISLATR